MNRTLIALALATVTLTSANACNVSFGPVTNNNHAIDGFFGADCQPAINTSNYYDRRMLLLNWGLNAVKAYDRCANMGHSTEDCVLAGRQVQR